MQLRDRSGKGTVADHHTGPTRSRGKLETGGKGVGALALRQRSYVEGQQPLGRLESRPIRAAPCLRVAPGLLADAG